jgi:hypothetical protein
LDCSPEFKVGLLILLLLPFPFLSSLTLTFYFDPHPNFESLEIPLNTL